MADLKERLLDDCMSTDDELELDISNAEEDAANDKLNPIKRGKAKKRLQKLKDIYRIKDIILATQKEIARPRKNFSN